MVSLNLSPFETMSSFEYETFKKPETPFEALVQMACWAKQLEEAKAASSSGALKELVLEPQPKKRALKRAREIPDEEEPDLEKPPKRKSTKTIKNHVLYLSYLNTFPEFERKMNEDMRKQALLNDRYVGEIVDKRLVQCAGCKQNRKLDGDYFWNNWRHHRRKCKVLFETWLKEEGYA